MTGPWRLGGAIRLLYRVGEEEYRVEVERSRNGTLKLRVDVVRKLPSRCFL